MSARSHGLNRKSTSIRKLLAKTEALSVVLAEGPSVFPDLEESYVVSVVSLAVQSHHAATAKKGPLSYYTATLRCLCCKYASQI